MNLPMQIIFGSWEGNNFHTHADSGYRTCTHVPATEMFPLCEVPHIIRVNFVHKSDRKISRVHDT